jgi:hypothetical protein
VIRISLPFLYRLAGELDAIANLRGGGKIIDSYTALLDAQIAIDGLLNNSVFSQLLRSCRESGNALLSSIEEIIINADPNANLENYRAASLVHQFHQFEIALLAELGVIPTYLVTQKGGFETFTLLDWGNLLFPAELQQKVPEAIFDIQQAGKALAFELATAAGFHVFRATESILRRYYTHVTSGAAPPKVRSIAVYIRQLRAANVGNEVILATLDQMTRLHRNPLIHPEAVLTMDEAISTLGIARSAVTAMLQALPILAPTTGVP